MSAPRELISGDKAVALFAGAGAALVVAQALLPALPADAAHQVTVAAQHRAGETGSALAFLIAGILLVLGVAAGNRQVLGRGRVLTRIGLVVTGIGALWPVAGRAAFNTILVAVTGSGVQHASAVSAVHAISSSGAFAMFLPLLACFVLGPVLFAFGLRRGGLLPVWPAILWLVGVIVVNGAETSSRPVATIGMVAVAAAIAWIGTGVAKAQDASAAVPAAAAPAPQLSTR